MTTETRYYCSACGSENVWYFQIVSYNYNETRDFHTDKEWCEDCLDYTLLTDTEPPTSNPPKGDRGEGDLGTEPTNQT